MLEVCAVERKRIKVSWSKTKYLYLNDKETVKMEHTKVPRVKEFKYLGSTVQESGSCKREVKRSVQAGWNGWRKILGVICDRRLPVREKVCRDSCMLNAWLQRAYLMFELVLLFYQSCSASHNAYRVKFCNSFSVSHGQ